MQRVCNQGSCIRYAIPGKARCYEHGIELSRPVAKAKAAKRASAPGDGAAKRLRAMLSNLDTYNRIACAQCGKAFHPNELEVDHKLPLQDGGTDYDLNVWLLCRGCHGKKTVDEAVKRAARRRQTQQII